MNKIKIIEDIRFRLLFKRRISESNKSSVLPDNIEVGLVLLKTCTERTEAVINNKTMDSEM